MAQTPLPKSVPLTPQPRASAKKRISTADLMQGAREIIVLHKGEEYLLRVTKAGKLLLTK